jgi:hypothetical protein
MLASDLRLYTLVYLHKTLKRALKITQVYDPDLFTRTRLYGIAVRKCTHPDVVAYVQQLTQSLKVSLESGELA